MPKKLPADEERFVRFYIREGGVEEKIAAAEKRARLKVGTGKRLLKLKRVQDAVRERMEPIRLEQQRQEMLADAVQQVTARLEAEKTEAEAKLKEVLDVPLIAVQGNESRIDHELMRLVQLCPEKYGGIKLAAIKTAYVVAGLMEQGTTRRVAPADRTPGEGKSGVYTNVFDRLREERAAQNALPAEVVSHDEAVYDLTPQKVEAVVNIPKPSREMPVAGESIDEAPVVERQSRTRVITVEI